MPDEKITLIESFERAAEQNLGVQIEPMATKELARVLRLVTDNRDVARETLLEIERLAQEAIGSLAPIEMGTDPSIGSDPEPK